jgi:glycyl-tRNA synthetase
MHTLESIVARAKRRGFVYPWSDIYGGLANARDYGPYGVQLKKNIADLWWKTFVQERKDMVWLDAQILMHPRVRETSGHVGGFNDPLIDDKNTGERFRADKLIEECIDTIIKKTNKVDITNKIHELKAKISQEKSRIESENNLSFADKLIEPVRQKHMNEMKLKMFDAMRKVQSSEDNEKLWDIFHQFEKAEEQYSDEFYLNFLKSNASYLITLLQHERQVDTQMDILLDELWLTKYWITNLVPESRTFEQMRDFIVDKIPNNPISKKKANWTDVRKFSMMFYTYQGVIHDEENKIRLRPETAQGMFVNFKNIIDTMRVRLPFGIGQIGKAFRNEITPGNFLYRTREFEQMEIEYFVAPEEEVALQSIEKRKDDSRHWWTEVVKISTDNLRRRTHEADELSHYSRGTWDVEFLYPWWWGELQGLAYRTDFDLKAHQTASGKDFQYHDPISGKRFVPHVIEPSFGLSRMVLAIMLNCYAEETYTDGQGNEQTRTVVRFPKAIAPVRCAIIPLIKKDQGMLDLASKIYAELSAHFPCEYDDSGNIGKCYRRQDEIGTPYCITIDHQSLQDNTVTLRQRDDMSQERVAVSTLLGMIS